MTVKLGVVAKQVKRDDDGVGEKRSSHLATRISTYSSSNSANENIIHVII